jgi:hypothetical protein
MRMKDKKAKEDKVIKDKRAGKITVSQANKKLAQIKDSPKH